MTFSITNNKFKNMGKDTSYPVAVTLKPSKSKFEIPNLQLFGSFDSLEELVRTKDVVKERSFFKTSNGSESSEQVTTILDTARAQNTGKNASNSIKSVQTAMQSVSLSSSRGSSAPISSRRLREEKKEEKAPTLSHYLSDPSDKAQTSSSSKKYQ
ncbi:MAG: hypothetical protein JWO53_1189 [Chlamydiia bacterium]|nr:hypothetical protein [Chlamydiia bacterium]